MSHWLTRKALSEVRPVRELRMAATLSWPHLVALGVGAIVGTGILTLIGVGAARAGPAVLLSFGVAGLICTFVALCYAELATMISAAGSTYTYVALGEVFAWIVGWSLILEYTLVVSTVAVGWSGYATPLLISVGFPASLTSGPSLGGLMNLPAMLIVFVVAGLLMIGTRESARLTVVLVVVKLAALGVFVAAALPAFDATHLRPFMPYGFSKAMGADGVERGVMAAAAIIFFAFYGFDAVSTAAEETKTPRDLIIGLVGSMAACTVIYMLVTIAALGSSPISQFADSPEPLALILRSLGRYNASRILTVAAVVTLPTVLLAFLYGQTRIFLAMARDGFLAPSLAQLSPRGMPTRAIIATAVCVAILSGALPVAQIAALANAGTLIAFTAAGACVLRLRSSHPDAPRPFTVPVAPVIASGAILGCVYLFTSLPNTTLISCLIWNTLGLVLYTTYFRRRRRCASGAKPRSHF